MSVYVCACVHVNGRSVEAIWPRVKQWHISVLSTGLEATEKGATEVHAIVHSASYR